MRSTRSSRLTSPTSCPPSARSHRGTRRRCCAPESSATERTADPASDGLAPEIEALEECLEALDEASDEMRLFGTYLPYEEPDSDEDSKKAVSS